MKNYESLIEALTDLKARSYTQDFELEATTLHCGGKDAGNNPHLIHWKRELKRC
jgi:hypothetical protein